MSTLPTPRGVVLNGTRSRWLCEYVPAFYHGCIRNSSRVSTAHGVWHLGQHGQVRRTPSIHSRSAGIMVKGQKTRIMGARRASAESCGHQSCRIPAAGPLGQESNSRGTRLAVRRDPSARTRVTRRLGVAHGRPRLCSPEEVMTNVGQTVERTESGELE